MSFDFRHPISSLKAVLSALVILNSVIVSASEMPIISNGAVAQAYPVSNITIDGNINDWPSKFEEYPIALNYDGTPEASDFKAYFKVGYNLEEGALYVMLEVIDDDHIIDTSENSDWNTQDTWNFYLDPRHSIRGSGVNLFQYGMNFKDTTNSEISWDPEEKNLTWDHVTMIASRKGNSTFYEGKVILGGLLKVGGVLGMDHVLIDKDEEDGNQVGFNSWGHDTGKSQAATKLGDVLIVEANQKMKEMTGSVQWQDATIPGMVKRVLITSQENSDFWNIVRVDSLGNYKTTLPYGEYTVSPFWAFHTKNNTDFRINRKNSNNKFSVGSSANNNIPPLKIASKTAPKVSNGKGIISAFDAKNPKILDDFIENYRDYYEIPGVSLAIIKGGKVVYQKNYGVSNAYTEKPVDDSTLFEAASITKPVFAVAVCRLAARGIIDLDKPLYEYLTFEDIAHDERYKLITARHVLTHKTGFPNWARNGTGGRLNINFIPGEGYGYSGEGFEYLKRVVMEITGKDTNTILREEVLEPMAIKNTYFSHNEYLASVVANGHFSKQARRATLPSAPGVAWSMHTNAKEFSQFALALLERKGMEPKTYDEMFKIETVIPKNEDNPGPEGFEYYFGLGIAMEKTPVGPTFGHSGSNGDFKCMFKMYPDMEAGYIIFTNSENGDYLHSDLNQFLFTGAVAE